MVATRRVRYGSAGGDAATVRRRPWRGLPPTLAAAVVLLGAMGSVAQDSHSLAPPPLVDTPRSAAGLTDPITQLARRLATGQASLTFEPGVGLLPSVLRELAIPVSSQTLVFSKTSLQSRVITPRTPRAIYFNDTVYVGYVPDGTLLELAAVDPQAGAVFYTISQAAGARPRLVTNADCVQCHATPSTLGLPGFLLRSVFARPDGQVAPRTTSFITDHRSPIRNRWGGWYVTGFVSGSPHMGNAFLRAGEDEASFTRAAPSSSALVDQIDRARYPSPDSDVVALLVLDHQAHMHNLISRLRYAATQGAALDADVEALVRYALFADEAPWPGPVTGTSTFATEFERRGPHDAAGRSLRQLDLTSRLFRYPASFLLYADEFARLPAIARNAVLTRLDAILSGREGAEAFPRLTPDDRVAVKDILVDTLPLFAAHVAR